MTRLSLVVVVWLLLTAREVQGQEEVHPDKFCQPDDNGLDWVCGIGQYCTHNSDDMETSVCDPCPPPGKKCNDLNLPDVAVDHCLAMCDRNEIGTTCSSDDPCSEGLFCNFEYGETGICEKCKSDVECLVISSEISMASCIEQCSLKCYDLRLSKVSVDGVEISSYGLDGSPVMSASGPLVDCSILVDEDICPGANNSICLVEDHSKDSWYFELVWRCEKSGGVALMLFGQYPGSDDNEYQAAWLSFQETSIPSVSISYNDGKDILLEEKLGMWATLTLEDAGPYCFKDQNCSTTIPCIGHYGDGLGYCEFIGDTDEGMFCGYCPVNDDNGDPDPYKCFFDRLGGFPMEQNQVEACAVSCASSLKFGSCKFCPEEITGFEFGVEKQSDRCYFCPEDDVKYPDREVPVFGEATSCWQMQSFFNKIDVHKDSLNCRLSQMLNYICGCKGPGYAGASTDAKKAALVWVPRVMAILSFMGSSFIAYDASRSRERRQKIFYQLMLLVPHGFLSHMAGLFSFAIFMVFWQKLH